MAISVAQEGAAQATQPPPVPTPPDQPPVPTPAPDAPALAPTAGAPIGINVPGVGMVIPMTRDQLRALDSRASRLSDQLQSAQGRRDRTARSLEDASSSAERSGLEDRLTFLDERILSIEREMAENSGLRASLSATLRPSSSSEEGVGNSTDSDGSTAELIVFVVLFAIAMEVARSIWRRRRRKVAPSSAEQEARFAQLEQAIDTVAVEIERVSEGQRFVTKLLREGRPIPDFTAQRAADEISVGGGSESAR